MKSFILIALIVACVYTQAPVKTKPVQLGGGCHDKVAFLNNKLKGCQKALKKVQGSPQMARKLQSMIKPLGSDCVDQTRDVNMKLSKCNADLKIADLKRSKNASTKKHAPKKETKKGGCMSKIQKWKSMISNC